MREEPFDPIATLLSKLDEHRRVAQATIHENDWEDVAQEMAAYILDRISRGKRVKGHLVDARIRWRVRDARRKIYGKEDLVAKKAIPLHPTIDWHNPAYSSLFASQPWNPYQWREPNERLVMFDEGWRPLIPSDTYSSVEL